MTREEAHAQAEREVTEYARRGHLERISESDKPLLLFAAALLRTASEDMAEKVRSGSLHTGEVVALAALCIELLRESHLRYGGKPPAEA